MKGRSWPGVWLLPLRSVAWKRRGRTGWKWVCGPLLEERMRLWNGVGGGDVGLNETGEMGSGIWRVEM